MKNTLEHLTTQNKSSIIPFVFKTNTNNYKGSQMYTITIDAQEIDKLDDCISQINIVAHLFECVFTYADTVGTNTRQDLETGYFLGSILKNISNDINKYLNKGIKNDRLS